MSPLMAPLMLIVLLGTIGFFIALIARKRGCALKLLACPLLVLLWLLSASIAPNAHTECERLFGQQVSQNAKQLQSLKPFGMDGFLLSFQISRNDFYKQIAPSFSPQLLGGIHFFGGGKRPELWPEELETMNECLRRDVGEDPLLVHYDEVSQTVYASFIYWGW